MLWDVERAEEADRVTTPLAGDIWSVAFSPDGSTVLFGDDQGNVSYWRLVVEPAHMAAAVAWAAENRVPTSSPVTSVPATTWWPARRFPGSASLPGRRCAAQ